MWERGRYVEYLFAFTFFKRIQNHYGKPMISSGCFSAYRTNALRQVGGWSNRTMAEDMDLTWTLLSGRVEGQVRTGGSLLSDRASQLESACASSFAGGRTGSFRT